MEITACTGLTGEINETFTANKKLKVNAKSFVASSNTTAGSKEGHLRAYPIGSDGVPATSASWDVADQAHQMTDAERKQRLYSTDSNDSKVLFDDLDTAAFVPNAVPDAATTKLYTFSPSYGNGTYLAGRRDGSFLGPISPKSSLVLLSRDVDTFTYLKDATYRSFYSTTIANRTERIVLSSDDGFVYAFNQSDGDLAWGWMPRSLVKELYNYSSYLDAHLMQGTIDILTLKDANDAYNTYVVGSYKDGLGQYVLKLDANGDLGAVIWDIDHQIENAVNDSSPNHGQRVYFKDSSNTTYMAYVVTTLGGVSTLHIRSITDDLVKHVIPLNFTATSTPYVMKKLGNALAPAENTLYLGDSNGSIHSAALLITVQTDNGKLDTDTNIGTDMNNGAVTAMDSSHSSPVLFIAASTSKNIRHYLRAQSKDRLSVMKYLSSNSTWQRQWTTIIGSAGKWVNGSSTLTADANITSLPSNANITDNATTTASSIVLPVTLEPAGSSCHKTAYYYLYDLVDGHAPTKTFYEIDGSAISAATINLGKGTASKLKLHSLKGTNKLLGFGVSDQNTSGGIGVNKTMYIEDPVSTGIRSWKVLK